jgi:hypothetical protein
MDGIHTVRTCERYNTRNYEFRGANSVGLSSKAAIRPGKLYPDTEPWAVRAIRINRARVSG